MDLDENSTTSDPEMFISGAFGTLSFGSVDFAMDAIGLADVGFDGLAVDDALEALRGSGVADIVYSYSIDGLTLVLSTNVGASSVKDAAGEGDFSMLVGYKMGDLGVELGYSDDHSTGDTSTGLELAYKVGAVSLGATLIQLDYKDAATRDLSGYGVSVGYAVNDALSVTAVYASSERGVAGTNDLDASGIGFAYKLGGGLSVQGGASEVDNINKWDLGLAMSF